MGPRHSRRNLERIVCRSVNVGSQVYGRLTFEIVVGVSAVGSPNVHEPEASGAVAIEEHPVPVARKAWNALRRRCVDDRPQVYWWAPRILDARPLRNPDVLTTEAGGSAGTEIQAQPVLR